MGSTAISVEAVRPSLDRLGDGDGGIWAEERGEDVRGDEGCDLNGGATTRGRVPSLVNEERRSDGGGAGVGGSGSGSRGCDAMAGIERPVLFQLQVRDVLCSLLLPTEESRSEGGRESVVLFVAVRQRDAELASERGELGESGGPSGSRGAKLEALAGLASIGVWAAVGGQGISGRGHRIVPVFAIVEPRDESVDDVLRVGVFESCSMNGSEKTEDGAEGGAGGRGIGIGVVLVGGWIPELAELLVLDGGWGFIGRGGCREGRID